MNDLIATIDRKLDAIAEQSLTRRLRVADSPCAPRQIVDGREMLAFCSNDYLGLAAHPAVIAALREGAERYGAGSGASPIACRSHQRWRPVAPPRAESRTCHGAMCSL